MSHQLSCILDTVVFLKLKVMSLVGNRAGELVLHVKGISPWPAVLNEHRS